jgi:hypothetical protein
VGAVEGDAEPEAEFAVLVGAVLGVIEVEVVSGASLVLYFRSSPCCTLQLQYPPVQGGDIAAFAAAAGLVFAALQNVFLQQIMSRWF